MKVFVNGTFDIFQTGHINLLLKARVFAGASGRLIVAIDADERVTALKGVGRPIFTAAERGKALYDLEYQGKPMIDQVEFFQSDADLIEILSRHKPDMMLKGSDWEGKTIIGAHLVKAISFYKRLGEYSTTEIIKRCKK